MINVDRKKPGLYVHYDWHYFWEYGNGEIGNQGVHQMDIACWGHNRGLPVKVYSSGGRFGLNDDGQTPNTQATTFTYADGSIMTFQVRNLGSFEEFDGGNCGNSFFGTKGFYVVGKGFFSYKEGKKDGKPSDARPSRCPTMRPKPERGNKWERFFKAVRSRNPADMPVSTARRPSLLRPLPARQYRLSPGALAGIRSQDRTFQGPRSQPVSEARVSQRL